MAVRKSIRKNIDDGVWTRGEGRIEWNQKKKMEMKLFMPRAIDTLRCLCLLLLFSPLGYLHFVPGNFMRKQINNVLNNERWAWFSVLGSHNIKMVIIIEQLLNPVSHVRFPFWLFWILGSHAWRKCSNSVSGHLRKMINEM